MLRTFQSIYTEVLDRMGQESTFNSTDLKLVNLIKKFINRRYQNVCAKHPWDFLMSHGVITTTAEYTDGTIAITNGGTTITGTDTTFTQAMTGRKFKTDAFEEIYKISKYTSGTSLTIESIFNGDTETDGSFSIFKDEYLCDESWREILNIRQYRNPVRMEQISMSDFRSKYLDTEPINADPYYFAYDRTKEVQRLTTTNLGGTGSFEVGDTITGNSTNSYGICIKVSNNEGILYVQVLYGEFTTSDSLTNGTRTSDLIGVSYAGSYLKVIFYPCPYRAIKLDCDVILKPDYLIDWDDEPLIPENYRDILVYGACADLSGYLNRKTDERKLYENIFMRKLYEMESDLFSKSVSYPQLISGTKWKSYDGYNSESDLASNE